MDQRPQTFGVLVRTHRVRAGLGQLELARRAGLSVRALREIERERVRQPRARAVSGLVGALRLPEPEQQGLLTAGGAGQPVNGRIRVGVLGPLTVHRGAVALEVTGPRRRVLLGLLAIQPNQAVAADEIIECLWDGDPPTTCRSLVHGHIGALRRLLEPAREPRGTARTLVCARGGYLLVAGEDDVDLSQFDRLVTRAHALLTDGNVAAAQDAYAEALDRWRGSVVSNLRQSALRQHPAVVAASGRRLIAALAYADLALASGRPHHAVERLQALVSDEPLHEGLHARLILALAATGRQAAALSRYDDLRARLAGELGLEPGPDLRAAHVRVLRQEVPTAVPEPTGSTAGSASARVPPAQLPADLPTFTGRTRELRQLGALPGRRGSSGVTIVVVAGTAGVGKTALVVHCAHRLASRFPDGQLYADLRGYAIAPPVRPEEVLARFLHALGVEADQVPADRDEAAALYRSLMAGRRILVVLDNARDARQVRPLLPGSPSCVVLVTSRNRLTALHARESARHVTLDVLTPGEAHRLLARILPAARVRDEPAAVEALAHVCAYLPLALGIAAAKLAGEGMGVAAYVTRLSTGNRLAELEVDGDPDTAVRATFDLSYAVLAPATARLFCLLGVVPGPDVTAEAAAALVGAPVEAARRLLEELAAVHLIGRPAPGRYAFHDLLRRYAADLATAKESGPACAAGPLAAGRALPRD
jgi:DNA-binding SARP family transcriptional activator